ncbi:MAG: hypothetical protein COA78_29235 [Blastopirellula sp.]|nr:MAG: hypothetical protein COA78_29235 [Blastopirellula sp.]
MKWLPKFRFSLRTLMIFTTLLAVGLSYVGNRIYRAERQKRAVAWILEHTGGTVTYYYEPEPIEDRYAQLFQSGYTESEESKLSTPKWLRDLFGDNYFEYVRDVSIPYRFLQDTGEQLNDDLTDIGLLSDFTKLKTLQIYAPQLTDLSPLADLKELEELSISVPKVTDIGPLAKLENLVELDIRGENITDISPLAGLTNLKQLDIAGTKFSDLAPLSGLKKLEYLNISYREFSYRDLLHKQITDITPLAELTNLIVLEMSNTDVSDISPLANLKNLVELEMSNTIISDLSPLSGLTNLERLFISGRTDTDLFPLAKLTKLKELYIYDNVNVSSPLTGFDNPGNLIGVRVPSRAAMARFAKKKPIELNVSRNEISNLSPLAALTNLEKLHISITGITDLSPLRGLKKLESLYIDIGKKPPRPLLYGLDLNWPDDETIGVTEADIANLKKALPDCNARIYQDD